MAAGSMDRLDDRTFNVNFSGEGAARLWDTVKLKLKEFMPDYADDTLVVSLSFLSPLFFAFITLLCPFCSVSLVEPLCLPQMLVVDLEW